MSNKSMIIYKENFISKIKNFFKSLFKNNKDQNNYNAEEFNSNDAIIDSDKKENEFFDKIKVDSSGIDKIMEKNNFLDYIDGNVEALKLLSVDRLRKLKAYYDDVIEENERIIEKLKNSS